MSEKPYIVQHSSGRWVVSMSKTLDRGCVLLSRDGFWTVKQAYVTYKLSFSSEAEAREVLAKATPAPARMVWDTKSEMEALRAEVERLHQAYRDACTEADEHLAEVKRLTAEREALTNECVRWRMELGKDEPPGGMDEVMAETNAACPCMDPANDARQQGGGT